MTDNEVRINDLDLITTINLVNRVKNKLLALMLKEIEEILSSNQENVFPLIRKSILDFFNEYTRAILRIVVSSDIEGLLDK